MSAHRWPSLTPAQRWELVIYACYLTLMLGMVAWVCFPQTRAAARRSWQYARYYQWRAEFRTLPPWAQEMLIVRGKGPIS